MAITISSPFRVRIRAKSDGALNIPNEVFVAKAMPNLHIGKSPWVWGHGVGGQKHHMIFNDKKRQKVIFFGGDHRGIFWKHYNAPAAQPESFSYDVSTDTWANISSASNGPGTIVPCRPNDGNPSVHDTKRDRYWVLPGGWAAPGNSPHLHGSVLTGLDYSTNQDLGGFLHIGKPVIAGSTLWNGLMWFDPNTELWTGVTNASIGSPAPGDGGTMAGSPLNAGIYDPKQDCIHSVGGSQSVYAYRVLLNDNPALITVSQTTVTGGALPNGKFAMRLALQHPCYDIQGRKCYVLTLGSTDGATGDSYVFFRYDLDNPGAGVEMLATPPNQTPVHDPNGTGGSCKILFDTTNRRVLWPKHDSPDGLVTGMASYDIAGNQWTTHPLTISGSNGPVRSEEHTSELQSLRHLVCRL